MRCKESNAVRHHLLPLDLSKTSYSVTILKIRSLSDDGFEEGDIDFEGWDEGIKDGLVDGTTDGFTDGVLDAVTLGDTVGTSEGSELYSVCSMI